MKNSRDQISFPWKGAFVTPAVLMIVTLLLVLGIGALAIVSNERKTSRSHLDALRAELAVKTGMEDVRSILTNHSLNDDFLIIQSKSVKSVTAGGAENPHLFLVRGKRQDDSISYDYTTLFSASKVPPTTPRLTAPDLESCLPTRSTERTEIPTHRYLKAAPVAWKWIRDDEERIIARYAYFVEDLQSRLDPALSGNQSAVDGTHARTEWPFPVSGMSAQPQREGDKSLSQVKLNALEPVSGTLTQTFESNRDLLVSPGSLLAAADLKPPIRRDETTGRILDPLGQAVEENLVSGILAYEEQPIIPFLPGIDPAAAGKPKLNLNRLLATGGDDAVDEMAEWMKSALPEFETRKGAFKEDYLKTLAANAIDYADEDSYSTRKAGRYRGVDSFPLVSEFAMKTRWENVSEKNGKKYVSVSVRSYAELWNMTDQVAEGQVNVSYENFYELVIQCIDKTSKNPAIFPDLIYPLKDLSNAATNGLFESEGYQWFPSQMVTMQPNEYRLLSFGPVTYEIEVCDAKYDIVNPIEFNKDKTGKFPASFRLRWNGEMVDQLEGINWARSSLYYAVTSRDQQFVRLTHPALKHGVYSNEMDKMGDIRTTYYLESPSYPRAFPGNYSPNRRNICYSLYLPDPFEIAYRVLPSEWPDGGHNSPYGSKAFHTADKNIMPDDPRYFEGVVAPRKEEAPVRISNAGRFYSAVELGKIFDPLMWQVSQPTGSARWGDVTLSSIASENQSGGNTLRIGRPEHPRFSLPGSPGMHACRLLDLFHTGLPRADDKFAREGPVVKIHGHINVNTATRDVLRAALAGPLVMDPILARRTSEQHDPERLAPPVESFSLFPPSGESEADRVADAIISARPFASTADLAQVQQTDGQAVFGNSSMFADGEQIEWSDSAAEELFGRIYEASTVRSRNFRVWVVGQCLSPQAEGFSEAEVLAESRKVFTVFADPGERTEEGAIDLTKAKIRIINECEF
jgi:hypothetical protein